MTDADVLSLAQKCNFFGARSLAALKMHEITIGNSEIFAFCPLYLLV